MEVGPDVVLLLEELPSSLKLRRDYRCGSVTCRRPKRTGIWRSKDAEGGIRRGRRQSVGILAKHSKDPPDIIQANIFLDELFQQIGQPGLQVHERANKTARFY